MGHYRGFIDLRSPSLATFKKKWLLDCSAFDEVGNLKKLTPFPIKY